MKKVDLFDLSKHVGSYDTWPQTSELIMKGRPAGLKIPGYVLEAQYRHAWGYLLVASWDCPFEEAQTFMLLSPELELLAEKTIGAPYATVLMESHEPVDETSALFHCDGDLDVLATVVSGRKLKLKKINRATGKPWPG